MDTSELIEKQIEEATEHFNAMIEAHKQGHMNTWGKAIEGCCGNLLRIVQNQQNEIEALKSRSDELKSMAHDHIGGLL